MTKQEIFDKVVEGAIIQQGRSITIVQFDISEAPTPIPRCSYRSDTGKKCFIGMLIPDEHYTKQMEGETFSKLLTSMKTSVLTREFLYDLIENASCSTEDMINFMGLLQTCHDASKTAADVYARLFHLAERYKLNVSLLEDNKLQFSNWEDDEKSEKESN